VPALSRGLLALLAALALLCGVLSAQESGPATLVVSVKDVTGGAILGATVVIVPSTSASPRVLTALSGDTVSVGLAAGSYAVTVRANGFSPVKKTIDLHRGDQSAVVASLMPGSCPPGSCFTVTAELPVLTLGTP
jgi:hypothetical protein